MSPTATSPSDSVGAKADRRRSPRTPHVAEAWITSPTATSTDERIEVASMNLARHGVGFELARAIPENTFYVMEIGMGEQRLLSEIRIISCRKSDHGTWEVGAEFC